MPAKSDRGQRNLPLKRPSFRGFLQRASGQRPGPAKAYLRDAVAVAEDMGMLTALRQEVMDEYPQLLALLDRALLDSFERIGLEVLEEEVRRRDRSRGVTFGALVKPRVADATSKYLTGRRIKTIPSPDGTAQDGGDDAAAQEIKDNASVQGCTNRTVAPRSNAGAREMCKSEANGYPARISTGSSRVTSYAGTPSPNRDRLIPANPNALGEEWANALAELTSNERAVYEGRVLAEPRISCTTLAAQLGVSRPRVVALEKQAHRRMNKLLKRGG
jgi:DNA-directed RNA polymerase specialized sigma subunit